MTFPIRIDFAITEDTYPKLLDFLKSHATDNDERPHIGVTIGWITTPGQAAQLAAAEPRMPEACPSNYLDFEVTASNARVCRASDPKRPALLSAHADGILPVPNHYTSHHRSEAPGRSGPGTGSRL